MGEVKPTLSLEYRRDGIWQAISHRLMFPAAIRKVLGGTSTADLRLENSDGLLARDNSSSYFNVNTMGQFDPLLDEGRLIRLWQGIDFRTNAASGKPVAGTPPVSGSLLALTDQNFASDPTSVAAPQWISWQDAQFDVKIDLGSVNSICGVSVSALSKSSANRTLPTSIQLFGSTTSQSGPFESLGAFDLSVYGDSPSGQTFYLHKLLGASARWILLRFSPKGSCWHQLDEVEVYTPTYADNFREKAFMGILGDDIGQSADGIIELLQVRDNTKKLDDEFASTYLTYANTAPEHIMADLLTNSFYGLRLNSADFNFNSTNFTLPRWTSQNQSIYKSCLELASMLGWAFEADESGVFRFYEPDPTRFVGEEIYLPELNLRNWRKNTTGKSLRNHVVVRFRDTRQILVSVEAKDANSIQRFGDRTFVLEEPTIKDAVLARQLAGAMLRDYGYVVNHGAGEIDGDPYLRPGQVITVVESATTASRSDQLYRITALESEFDMTPEVGLDWRIGLTLRGYRYRAPSLVQTLRAFPGSGSARLEWGASPEAYVTAYNAYISTAVASVGSLFADVNSLSVVAYGLANGTQYWFRVAAHTAVGIEGDLAGPVGVTPQSGASGETEASSTWAISSLSAARVLPTIRIVKLSWPRPTQGMPAGWYYNIFRSKTNTLSPVILATAPPRTSPEVWFDQSNEIRTAPGVWWYRVAVFNPRDGFQGRPSPWAVQSLS